MESGKEQKADLNQNMTGKEREEGEDVNMKSRRQEEEEEGRSWTDVKKWARRR